LSNNILHHGISKAKFYNKIPHVTHRSRREAVLTPITSRCVRINDQKTKFLAFCTPAVDGDEWSASRSGCFNIITIEGNAVCGIRSVPDVMVKRSGSSQIRDFNPVHLVLSSHNIEGT